MRAYCFFFNDTATTEIYTLSLHDALPIWGRPAPAGDARGAAAPRRDGGGAARRRRVVRRPPAARGRPDRGTGARADRESTRLKSSHANISFAVFCFEKKRQDTLS